MSAMSAVACATCRPQFDVQASDSFCGKCGKSNFCCKKCNAPFAPGSENQFCGGCGASFGGHVNLQVNNVQPSAPAQPYVNAAVQPQAFLYKQDSVVGRMQADQPPPQLIQPEPPSWMVGQLISSMLFLLPLGPLIFFGFVAPSDPARYCPTVCEESNYFSYFYSSYWSQNSGRFCEPECALSGLEALTVFLILFPWCINLCVGCRKKGTMGYLNKLSAQQQAGPVSATKLLQKMVDGNPDMYFHVRCYHTERRTSGSGKNRSTRTVTVTTYSESFPIANIGWVDVGGDPGYPREFDTSSQKFFAIRVQKETLFDPAFQVSMDTYKQHLYATNCHRDRSCSVTYNVTFQNFEDQVLAWNDHDQASHDSVPCCMQSSTLGWLTMLGMNWFHAIWFQRSVCKGSFVVKKKLVSGVINKW